MLRLFLFLSQWKLPICVQQGFPDVLSLKWEQVGNDGIFISRGKQGKTDKAWSPRLQAAIEKAKQVTNIRLCNQQSMATG